MRKKAYQSVPVKRVLVSEVVQRLAAGPLSVGLDIAKAEVLAVVRDQDGKFEHPWKVRQPDEIGQLIERLTELSQGRELVIAMESTGTYGDPLRQALADAGLALQRVSAKAASDYSEVFDNVPSQHDGKDAAVIAELAALKKSALWPCQPPLAWEGELADQVQWMDTQQQISAAVGGTAGRAVGPALAGTDQAFGSDAGHAVGAVATLRRTGGPGEGS